MAHLNPNSIVTLRQGNEEREFVKYAGLLDFAHQLGLTSLVVELVQTPNETNGYTAICRATATVGDKKFVDYGDANPENVTKLVAKHIIRMASTRAKARVLRDMGNIGITCLEEIGDDSVVSADTLTEKYKNIF